MKIREMLPSDLVEVAPMYIELVEESLKEEAYIPYPFTGKDMVETQKDFTFWMLKNFKFMQDNFDKQGLPRTWRGAVICPQGNVPKGFLTGEICHREFGFPKTTVQGQIFYIKPEHRNKGYGRGLIHEMYEWSSQFGVEAIEALYTPGSNAHKMWAASGVRTYMMFGVFAADDWKPTLGEPLCKAGVRQDHKSPDSPKVPLNSSLEESTEKTSQDSPESQEVEA